MMSDQYSNPILHRRNAKVDWQHAADSLCYLREDWYAMRSSVAPAASGRVH